MSGTMMPPGGQQPQIPPQVLQALMAQMQGQRGPMPPQQGAPPAGPPQGMPQPQGQPPAPPPQLAPRLPPPGSPGAPPPPAAPPQMPPGMNPNLQMFARAAQAQPGGPGGMRLNPAEMAQMGRFGDSIVAHLTPGEIEVPPQVQTPKVLATIQQAMHRAGVSPQQFTAGSPQSSHNPATGAPEYNLLSALLPVLGGAAASVFAPELLPGIFGAGGALGAAGGAAAAGGLGSAAGSLLGGGNANQALMSGLGGAAGGYFGAPSGAAGAGSGGPAMISPQPMPNLATPSLGAAEGGSGAVGGPGALATGIPGPSPGSAGMFGNLGGGQMGGLKQALYSGLGGGIGSMLAPGTASNPIPASFTNSMPPLNRNYNAILGNANSPTPSFAGYNPIQSVQGGQPYNFYAPHP